MADLIHFNIPPFIGSEIDNMRKAAESHKICGDGEFTHLCSKWFEENFRVSKALLTTSGTSALEMAALLCGIEPMDEVILPSYTFSSTANAFVLAGAKLVFVDIKPETMNIDENKIEQAITDRTKVICVVHYAGVACDMDKIMDIAGKYNLKVVEDAAQAVTSKYKGIYLGTIGDFGCYSFHETKNFSMGEGGALVINDPQTVEKAEILREKGTNRSKFFRGEIDKYTWVDYGSSYLPSDMNAAYLWTQLTHAKEIQDDRIKTWNRYYKELMNLEKAGIIKLPVVPSECVHNAHMFYLKCKNQDIRSKYIKFMRDNDILCVFHYVPLHNAPAGLKYGRFNGSDRNTVVEADKLVRLPLYFGMNKKDQDRVIEKTYDFFMSSDVNNANASIE